MSSINVTFPRANDFLSLPSIVSFAIVAYIVHCFVQNARLRHFKGPPTTGFSKLWLLRAITKGNMHIDFQKVNQKYGALNLKQI
jgi:hypothetical protein